MVVTFLFNFTATKLIRNFSVTSHQLFLIGHPTEDEVDLMILASQWAGAACVRQVKFYALTILKQNSKLQ